MPPTGDSDAMWRTGIAFWCSLWQAQLETSLRLWSAWAQAFPHESARELAEEAEAMKPASRGAPAKRPSAQRTAPRKAAPKSAAS
jgi:hypothetical protein